MQIQKKKKKDYILRLVVSGALFLVLKTPRNVFLLFFSLLLFSLVFLSLLLREGRASEMTFADKHSCNTTQTMRREAEEHNRERTRKKEQIKQERTKRAS